MRENQNNWITKSVYDSMNQKENIEMKEEEGEELNVISNIGNLVKLKFVYKKYCFSVINVWKIEIRFGF